MTAAIAEWLAHRGGGPLVDVTGLVRTHRGRPAGDVPALQGLDLRLGPGERVAVVGPSSSGKTTLMNVLAGLDRPDGGRVRVGGHDLLRLAGREREEYRRRVVGYVWQECGEGLWPALSALENVEVAMLGDPVRRPHRRERAARLLEALKLGARLQHLPHQLAGGERQRLALAVALANQPALLLADEPTAELDSVTAHALLADLEALLRDLGSAAVIATDDPRVERYVDRVVRVGGARGAAASGPDGARRHVRA